MKTFEALKDDVVEAAIRFVKKANAQREVTDINIDYSELKDTVDRLEGSEFDTLTT